MNNLLLLYTTLTNKDCAEKVAKKLIKNNLAACVSFKEINSFFLWDNNIQNENEYEMTIKSKPEKLDEIIKFLKLETGYEIPQIIYKNFESERNYYEWVVESTN